MVFEWNEDTDFYFFSYIAFHSDAVFLRREAFKYSDKTHLMMHHLYVFKGFRGAAQTYYFPRFSAK